MFTDRSQFTAPFKRIPDTGRATSGDCSGLRLSPLPLLPLLVILLSVLAAPDSAQADDSSGSSP